MKSLVWILCLGLLSVGCSKSTDTGGGGDSAEKKAITLVLDKDLAARVSPKPGSTTADSMRTIDLQGCPPTFQEAYRKHISAWEKKDLHSIDETYGEVKRIAREYGVDVSRFE